MNRFSFVVQFTEEGNKVYLQFTTDECLLKLNTQQVTTALLGKIILQRMEPMVNSLPGQLQRQCRIKL